jgi:non-ribosomal peptide synthetase component F
MNTLPLRIDLAAQADFPALVGNVKTTLLGALSHQDAPWQHVRAALAAEHGPSATGVGEVAFLMDDPAPAQFAAGGFTLSRIAPERIVARRELTVAMSTNKGQITGTATYDDALFEPQSIQRIVATFISALSMSNVECG